MKIRELMTTEVKTLKREHTLQEAAQMMSDLDVGIIPVANQGDHLEGVITDRDIVVRAVAKGMDINSTKINECLSPSVVTVSPEQTAQEAAKLMADNQVRRLPVVEDNRLVGIVAIGDLAVVGIHENEAGFALSEISEPGRPELH
ncbi:CBS domain-containing protein [Tumebacillus sp. ITR2]|uniref:CBS domain-containing protein n=1 Tax=Tumebacillus amylolyticus TaxID=2801339 RepID=A0ABS1J7M8_9BACL|nr:CBS domain-containing protein [Tumebacillus amylolyticus]MBL0386286.1 CBS domain-containing protein [Tumebacillus amylolyticus]